MVDVTFAGSVVSVDVGEDTGAAQTAAARSETAAQTATDKAAIVVSAAGSLGALATNLDGRQLPASPSQGVFPEVLDGDFRVMEGRTVAGKMFPDVSATAIAPVTAQVELRTLPASPSAGVFPFGFDGEYRIVQGRPVAGGPYPPASVAAAVALTPDDPRITVLNAIGTIERTPTRLRLTRPVVDANSWYYAMPGARIGFLTNALSVTFNLNWSNLTPSGSRNSVGLLLVDGAIDSTFTRPTASVTKTFGSTAFRRVEIVLPYADSLDLTSVVVPGAAMIERLPVPGEICVNIGDSITQELVTTDVSKTWPWLLAKARGWQALNMGFGGRQCVPADADTLAGIPAKYATILLGANDIINSKPIATFQADMESMIAKARAAMPGARIYVISPVYASSNAYTSGGDWRAAVASAEANAGDAYSFYVNGLSLMTNSADRLNPDGLHPNDLGASEIAANLAKIMQ